MNEIFLSFGSNLGLRMNNINKTLAKLKNYGKIQNSSFLYETNPIYNKNGGKYLNSVIKYKTNLNLQNSVNLFKKLEKVFFF